ncbi:hypothetical protein Nm8I071_56880 [Nonomuraea sp. TT08I-71]|nr:hypothetical protein Nm8I071_56880 [Nonomuraea sp. TT08I-71]
MSRGWEPKQADETRSLVYRSQFTPHVPDIRGLAAEHFSDWARSKGLVLDAVALLAGTTTEASSPDGVRRVATGRGASYADRSSGRRLQAALLRFEEHLATGDTWITSLTVATPSLMEQESLFGEPADTGGALFDLDQYPAQWPERSWVWLDLEHRRGEGRMPVRPGSPRLVRDLLAAVEGTDGSLPLTSDVLTITEGHVDELCGWLFDRERRVPIIVFTPDPQSPEAQARFAGRLARDVAGVAVVVRLADSAAAASFSRQVGPHLQVYGGAMRTYLPGLHPMEPFPRRHRVLAAATMRALGARSSNAVRDQVLSLSTRRPPPASYPLVQRVLARNSAHRNLAERRRSAQRPPASRQPALFSTDTEPVALPGIDESLGLAPAVPPSDESQTANRLLRSMLAAAGIDLRSVPATTASSSYAKVKAEQVALQELLAQALLSNSTQASARVVDNQLAAKLGEAEEEAELLYAEIEILETQLKEQRQARDELELVRLQQEITELELTDAERTGERLQARVRWLETELANQGIYAVGTATPEESLPEAPASIVEVIELATVHLKHIQIGATSDAAAGLDVHPQAERWAMKVWQALIALDAYAAARAAGDWSNSFLAWCQMPPSGARAIPATWVAMKESETTNTSPKLREARTFRIPRQVNSAARTYMPAHVKIQQGGTPCPRIHFHDDAGGATAKVYIGYIGDHLPTGSYS